MPRIDEQVADAIIYLYPSKETAEQGKRGGGTGFLVWIDSVHTNQGYLYAVTNKHVIDSGGTVIRINRHDGKTEIFDLDVYNWERHPDSDVAIAQLGRVDANVIKFRSIPISNFVTKDIIEKLDIGLGDDVYMVGRFIHHSGKTYNMPSTRSGIISVMPNPDELIELGEPPQKQEVYLVEMRSLAGYSGSPVVFDIPFLDILLKVLFEILRPHEPRLPENFYRRLNFKEGVDLG